ncbi:hypothetical protein [Flavobacterium chungangensis]|uniref:Uncharacterized protein n=1 Tax=Flavobacterium chungangensis TaxID=2708132 RepID=A0ABV8ZBE3_9FLAO
MTKNRKIKGAGDLVKVVTNTLGIEQCEGCIKRQDQLNKLIPFGKYELTDDDKLFLKRIENKLITSSVDRDYLFQIYNLVFPEKVKPCFCQDIMTSMIEKLLNSNEQI